MPPPDFFFALDLSDQAHFERMTTDVVASILKYAGFDAAAASDIGRELRDAIADAARRGGNRCDVRFQTVGGQLSVTVSGAGGEWRTSRPLP